MTRESVRAGEFLQRTAEPELLALQNILDESTEEWLERIVSRIDFAASGSFVPVCHITSADKPLIRYSKWKALHMFLESDPELRRRYYEAQPETPYVEGDDYVQRQIETGEMHPSVVHLWHFIVQDPNSDTQYIFKHLPGQDGEGWEYRVSIIK